MLDARQPGVHRILLDTGTVLVYTVLDKLKKIKFRHSPFSKKKCNLTIDLYLWVYMPWDPKF